MGYKSAANLESHIITTKNVPSIPCKLYIWNWCNYLCKKGSRSRCILLLKSVQDIQLNQIMAWNISNILTSNILNTVFQLKKLKGITNSLAWLSHSADCRRSISRIVPFELLYASVLQWVGWNSAHVITSEISQNYAMGVTK
jgi:hypothetical protein